MSKSNDRLRLDVSNPIDKVVIQLLTEAKGQIDQATGRDNSLGFVAKQALYTFYTEYMDTRRQLNELLKKQTDTAGIHDSSEVSTEEK